MVNLGGTQKVDFLGTCCGGDGSELSGNDILYGEKGSASLDFLGTCCGGDGSELLGNDILYGEKGSASRGSCKR